MGESGSVPARSALTRSALDGLVLRPGGRLIGRRTGPGPALVCAVGLPVLTRRHLDLKNLFYEKVRARGETPDSERRLRRETARLKRLREDNRKLIQQLEADNEALIGALHLTQLRNEELRRRLAESGGTVHAIGRI